jgi:hypothetical protein
MTMTRTPAANRFQPIDRPGHLHHSGVAGEA